MVFLCPIYFKNMVSGQTSNSYSKVDTEKDRKEVYTKRLVLTYRYLVSDNLKKYHTRKAIYSVNKRMVCHAVRNCKHNRVR